MPFSVNLGQKLILIFISSSSNTTDCVYGSKLSILLHRVLHKPLFSCKEFGNRKINWRKGGKDNFDWTFWYNYDQRFEDWAKKYRKGEVDLDLKIVLSTFPKLALLLKKFKKQLPSHEVLIINCFL